jgi:large subunit ribosomal protein L10
LNRAEKAEFVEDIRGQLLGSPFVVLTDFKGCSVPELEAMRQACAEAGVGYRVVKNTLCRRALADSPMEGLGDHFVGNTAVFVAGEDAVGAAKLLKAQLKDNAKITVRAGFFDGDVLDSDAVVKVADLPSREELLSMLLRTIQEGPRQILGVIQGPARDLLYVLNNYAAKLEEGA